MPSQTINQSLQNAIRSHQAGNLSEAKKLYQRILQSQPRHPDALHMLGLVESQLGHMATGIELITEAIAVNPGMAGYHVNLGKVLLAAGRPNEAENAFRHAIVIQPDIVDAYIGIANALHAQDHIERSIESLASAMRIAPHRADIHFLIGVYAQQAGNYADAITHYRNAIAIRPDAAQAHNNLGAALQLAGDYDAAAAAFSEAIRIQPDYSDALCNLAAIYATQGRNRDAATQFTAALKAKPDLVAAHCGLANTLRDLVAYDEAIRHYNAALAIDPDNISASFNLGGTYQQLGLTDKSISTYKQVAKIDPDNVFALNALVHQLHHVCAWDDVEEHQEKLLTRFREGYGGFMPFSFLSIPATAEDQLACARAFSDNITRHISPYPAPAPADRIKNGNNPKIRIGYLSSDYHEHATAYLISELFELHDKNRFEIFAYSFGIDDNSNARQRIVRACDEFIDIKNDSHVDSAAKIRSDGIDILVDLKGYTEGMRAGIPAHRPAPIQVNWLGYPGTMGTEFIDYIIADHYITPPGCESYYTEKIVRLPDCYQVNDRHRPISKSLPTRQSCGLPDDAFVFCSFNQTYKFNPPMFDIWMNLLKALPGSMLWLLDSNPFAAGNLRNEAQRRGVESERLVFAPKLPLAEHLARYALADLFLDTSPYNSHTTASDALWSGLPLITLAGDTFASRVAGSLLRNVGLEELITNSLEDYQACALNLAGDAELLNRLRLRLRDHRADAPLWDSLSFTRHIESAYQIMFERWLTGAQPMHIEVPRLLPANI